jgi:hypothetical protein
MELTIRFARFLAAVDANFFPENSQNNNLNHVGGLVFMTKDKVLSMDFVRELVAFGVDENDMDFNCLFEDAPTFFTKCVAAAWVQKKDKTFEEKKRDKKIMFLHLVVKYALYSNLRDALDEGYLDAKFLRENFGVFENAMVYWAIGTTKKESIWSKRFGCIDVDEEWEKSFLFLTFFFKSAELYRHASLSGKFFKALDQFVQDQTFGEVFDTLFYSTEISKERCFLMCVGETLFCHKLAEFYEKMTLENSEFHSEAVHRVEQRFKDPPRIPDIDWRTELFHGSYSQLNVELGIY